MMAFEKRTWSNGEILDANNMNRIESGIEESMQIWKYDIYKQKLDLPIMKNFNIQFETEQGTLKDDETGITGDYVSSIYRRRLVDKVFIGGGIFLYISMPSYIGCWVNFYDTNGAYLSNCGSTFYGKQTFNIPENAGYAWIIFRHESGAANTPSVEDIQQVEIGYTKYIEEQQEQELINSYNITANNAYNLNIQVEGGSIDLNSGADSDNIFDYHTKIRSGMPISLHQATSINFNTYLPECDKGYIIFYDNELQVLYNKKLTSSYGNVRLQGHEAFFRVVFNIGIVDLKTINITIFNAHHVPQEVKKIRWNQDYDFETITYPVEGEKTKCSSIRLFLPPNYSPFGCKKVPLIYYLPGSGNWYGWKNPNWPSNATLKAGLKYCMNEGFAVCCIYGWGDYYHLKYSPGSSHPYPTRTCLQVIQDGLKWICSRYNIDENNIHIMSKSQGGQCSAYFVSRPFKGLRSVGMFAPVVDYFSMPAEAMYNAPRKAIVEELGLEGEDAQWFCAGPGEFAEDYYTYSDRALVFIKNNKTKFVGMNEAWTDLIGAPLEQLIQESWESGKKYWNGTTNNPLTNLTNEDIYNKYNYVKLGKVPVKIWSAKDDASTPHWKNVEFIKQLENGGTEAEIYEASSGGHSAFDYGSLQTGVTSLGYPYSNVGIGYIQNIEWIRKHCPN